MSPGATKLTQFLEKHGISKSAASRALKAASHVTVLNWCAGISVPEPEFRKAIAVWTGGEVAEEDWQSLKEAQLAERLAGVEPFVPSGDEPVAPSAEPAA